jgi:hypothetical protein
MLQFLSEIFCGFAFFSYFYTKFAMRSIIVAILTNKHQIPLLHEESIHHPSPHIPHPVDLGARDVRIRPTQG